jgi:NADH:ubiquinone oxidoreductase subunit E
LSEVTEYKKILPEELYRKLDSFVEDLGIDSKDPRKKGYLIQVLHKAQSLFGYLPEEVQKFVARKLGVCHSEVSGVISFYNFFTTLPKGKVNISICMGTACFVRGSEKVLKEFENFLHIKSGGVTSDGKFSLDVLRCVGACGLAPVVMVGDRVYGNVNPKMVGDIMTDCIKLANSMEENK